MISHRHKCIFIHIAKCAGTSIENAFGVNVENHNAAENDFLFGWDEKNKLWLQHATPQTLIDLNYISLEDWNSYYKFIVYRNSWDRAYSDYFWMKQVRNVYDTFSNYIYKKGKYERILNEKETSYYAGDHLYLQKDYFFLNEQRINFDAEINFSELNVGFKKVISDLNLCESFFRFKLNETRTVRRKHYSSFYNKRKKQMVEAKYQNDIDFFKFKFEDKKSSIEKITVNFFK